jgi:hypothetical protein
MGLKSGFPIYPSGINYNVSLSFPGPPSIISEGKDSALMLPNSDYLVEFIGGNIGISDNMQKATMFKNLNSPVASSNEMVFRSFADTNKIELDSDTSKYEKNGKLSLPKDDIKLSPENDLLGLKGLEVTTLKSMFETQKPYMEIAKLVIGNLAKLEDITARVMPLLGVPLSTKSKKPKGNPDAIGYESGKELKKELAKIKAIQNKGGAIKVGPNGTIIKLDDESVVGNTNNSNNSASDGDWQIISAIYSTGQFQPEVDYKYKYIDLPADSELGEAIDDLNLDEDRDPYSKHKPKSIILGVFDSKGAPLNPLSKVKGINNQGEKVDTNFNKVSWLLDSPKWVFNNGSYQWPVFGGASTRTDGNGDTIYYQSGQINILNGEKAIPGTPIITGFASVEESEYRNFFTDLMNIKMLDIEDLTQVERNDIALDIVSRLNIKSHLENVFVWGQAKSSIYNKIGIPQQYLLDNGLQPSEDDPYPSLIKKSFKPFKIYSESAKNDEKLKEYARSKGLVDDDAGWIWVDPESDYVTKVIRVDPTTKITYNYAQGQPEVVADIKSFVKNVSTFQISDNRVFNMEVYRSVGDVDSDNNLIYSEFDISNDITSYDLENWNYIDNDGLVTEFGTVNNEPTQNSNSFKLTMWGNTPTPYYNTGENLYVSIEVSGSYFYFDEVENIGGNWMVKNNRVDLTGINGIESLSPEQLTNFYNNYKSNNGYTLQTTIDVVTTTGTGSSASSTTTQQTVNISGSSVFGNPEDITTNGKKRLGDQSLVEIEDNKILKWYYMIPNDDTGDYGNGNWNGGLPPNGTKRTFVIDSETMGNDNESPVDTNTDETIPEFQIRVRDDDSTGRVIDPSKVLNSQLTVIDPFSLGKYGHGSNDFPQDIDVIKRYMLTELDTESYYIIEGVLPDLVDDDGKFNNGVSSNTGSGGEGSYKLPDAIGAIKVFLSVLGDIFGKLIPTIIKTIQLFKNPVSFVTSIISEQMKDGFIFASDNSTSAFSEGKQFQDNIPNDGDERVRKRGVRDLGDFFKTTTLSNFIFVRDDGEFGSVIDGMAGIPFSIFGASIPFGMEMDFSKIPGSPINLAYPSSMNLDKVKNLQSFISPKSFDDTTASNLASQINEASKPVPGKDESNINPNVGGDRSDGKNSTKTKIEFEDGSSIFIDDGSVNDYVLDNKSRYNFVYVSEQSKNQLNEADSLIETGTEDNLKKALNILDDVSKQNPNNKEIAEKKDSLKDKLGRIQAAEQPLLKMILGLVTLPIKIIGGIIEWIMEFFKKMTNPMKLPSLLAEFLSFSWVTQFFTPKGLLEMAGIKIKPEKIAEWAALAKLPTLPKDVDLADLNEFLSLGFGVKLPTYTKEQYSAIRPDIPLRLMTALFCFIEKLINGIIDFIWSTLGIEAVIPPPHIKLCSDSDKGSMSPEDISKILSGELPNGTVGGSGVSNGSTDGSDSEFGGFYYEVELPDGEIKKFLDRESLDTFVEDNRDINYNFTF